MAGTIADKIQAILASKADIAAAIQEKGGTVPAALSGYGDAIRALPSGGDAEPADVEFIDYDGTVLYRYTYAQAKALTELPPLPTNHANDAIPLTAQGWNYTLQEIKDNLDALKGSVGLADVAEFLGLGDNATLDDVKQELGLSDDSLLDAILDAFPEMFVTKTTVGCSYITQDGATYVVVEVAEDSDRTFNFAFAQTTTSSVRLEWGDGDENNPVGSGNYTVRSHQYASSGTYTIKVTQLASGDPTLKLSGPICGLQSVGSTNIRQGTGLIKSIRLGKVSEISSGAFSNCITLDKINIPAGTPIGTNAFTGCPKLSAIVIPSGAQTIGQDAFSYCQSLAKVSIPASVETINAQAFKACGSLRCVCVTPNVTTLGNYVFSQCGSLVYMYGCLSANGTYGTSIFSYCSNLKKAQIADGVTLSGGCFNGCTSLEELNIEMKSLGGSTTNFFINCTSLKKVGVITASTVVQGSFSYCKSLEKLEFDDGGTQMSIATKAFQYSTIRVFDFSRCTQVPSITSTTFDNTTNDKVIIVPSSLYSSWVSAQYWSSLSSNIVSA